MFSTAAAAALAYGVYFHGIPYYKYHQASRALENAQYESAKEQFLALADYRDSAVLALECDYRAALSALNGGTYTSLRAAQSAFDALADYRDSAARAQEARYVYAEKLLAAGEWEQAIAAYEQVPAYSDSRMKRDQAEYEWAGALMEQGDYALAREKFLALADYQNAAVNAQECLYRPGAAALAQGDAAAAIEYFQALGDYRDSALQLQIAYYTVGDQSYQAEDYRYRRRIFSKGGGLRRFLSPGDGLPLRPRRGRHGTGGLRPGCGNVRQNSRLSGCERNAGWNAFISRANC